MQQVRSYLLRTIETSHLPNQNPESREVKEQYVLPRANVTVAKRGSQNNDVASAVKMPSAPDTSRGEQRRTHTSSHVAQDKRLDLEVGGKCRASLQQLQHRPVHRVRGLRCAWSSANFSGRPLAQMPTTLRHNISSFHAPCSTTTSSKCIPHDHVLLSFTSKNRVLRIDTVPHRHPRALRE